MSGNRKNKTETSVNERIYQEYLRIGILFEGIEETEFSLIIPYIKNAAFQKITLDNLSESISKSGAVEHYQNGASQSGMKPSSAMIAYNSLMRNYTQTMKTLCGWLPRVRNKELSFREKWDRERMEPEELEALLQKEREEKEQASSAWLEKLRLAYGGEPE